MKIYCFYLIGVNNDNVYDYKGVIADNITRLEDINISYSLYAFTPNKDIKNAFIKTHDMSKFICKKKYFNDELDCDIFYEDNSNYLLEYHKVYTRKIKNGRFMPTRVKIPCTSIENDMITTYKEENFFEILDDFFILLTEDELIENILLRFLNDDLMHDLNEVLLLDDLIPKHFPYEEGMPCDVMIDEFELYIRLFSNILLK